jgi:hypothetical protein
MAIAPLIPKRFLLDFMISKAERDLEAELERRLETCPSGSSGEEIIRELAAGLLNMPHCVSARREAGEVLDVRGSMDCHYQMDS